MQKQFFCFLLFLLATASTSILSAQNFKHNIDEAKKEAAEKDIPMALVFSGSDWCKPCIQLKTNVLQSDKFKRFSEEHLVLVELDFPYRRKNQLSKTQQAHNEKLAEKYNPKGEFPLIVFVDNNGDVKGKIGYDQRLSVEQYIQKVDKVCSAN